MQDIHRIKKALLLSGAKTILLFLLWLYNRRYTRADRMAKKAEKAAQRK